MADSFLDLEVDVNGEEVFFVNKVKIIVCLCCLSSLQLFRYLQFLGFFFCLIFYLVELERSS